MKIIINLKSFDFYKPRNSFKNINIRYKKYIPTNIIYKNKLT